MGKRREPKGAQSGIEKTVRKLQKGKGTKNAQPKKPKKGGRRGQ